MNKVVHFELPFDDKALEKIKAEGGSVATEKMPVGEMGFVAYFKDTEGNLLSLWETAPQNK